MNFLRYFWHISNRNTRPASVRCSRINMESRIKYQVKVFRIFVSHMQNTPTILHYSTYKEVNWHIDHWHFTISTLFPHIFSSHYKNILTWTSMPSMQQRTTSTIHTLWINALNGCSLPFFFLYTKSS